MQARLTAMYPDPRAAQEAERALTEAGFPATAITVSSPRSDPEAARAETRSHSESAREEHGMVLRNTSLMMGGVAGGAAGLAIGGIVFAIGMALTDQPPTGSAIGFLLACLAGGLAAGSVAGALLGAFASFARRRVREEQSFSREMVLTIELGDATALSRARTILQRTPARHIEQATDQRRAG